MKLFQNKSPAFKKLEAEINSCINCQRKISFKFEVSSGISLPISRCKKCQRRLDKIFPRGYSEYIKYLEGQR